MAVWSVFVSQHFIWAFSSVLHLRHRLANSQRVAVGMHYEKVGWRMGSYVRDTRSITDQLRKKCKQLRLWNVDCSLNRKQPQHNAMLSNNEVNLYPCGTAISLSYCGYLLHQIAEFTIPTVIQHLEINVHWKKASKISTVWKQLMACYCSHRRRLITIHYLSLIHIWRCRRSTLCRSRWSPYH